MVRYVKITKRQKTPTDISFLDRTLRGQPTKSKARKYTQSTGTAQPTVKAKAAGPLTWVTLLGTALSVTLFTISIVFGDGMSMLATILLSLLSTLTGVSNSWSLRLSKRRVGFVPEGDTVIRYPNGSFLIVKCQEDVARELFFAPEEIDYMITRSSIYRLISLVGTLMLMLGVIALANARLELQFAWAGAYIIVNAAHWIAAALPPASHWDFKCYELVEQGLAGGNANTTFTKALWKAIMVTQSTDWVRNGEHAAPNTAVWNEWLIEAKTQAKNAGEQKGNLEEKSWWTAANTSLWGLSQEWNAQEEWDRINREKSAQTV